MRWLGDEYEKVFACISNWPLVVMELRSPSETA